LGIALAFRRPDRHLLWFLLPFAATELLFVAANTLTRSSATLVSGIGLAVLAGSAALALLLAWRLANARAAALRLGLACAIYAGFGMLLSMMALWHRHG
jgi:hypothetical protein